MSWDPFGSYTLGPQALQLQKEREEKRKREVLEARARREKIAARKKESAEFQKNIVDDYLGSPINPEAAAPANVTLRRDFLPALDPSAARSNGAQSMMQQGGQSNPAGKPTSQQAPKSFGPLKRF